MKIQQIDVNSENAKKFNALVKDNNTIVFAAYVAHWCSHCQRLKGIWMRMLNYLSRVNVPNQTTPLVIAMIEESYFNLVPSSQSVQGYPTIKIFVKGEEMDNYSGERTPEAITLELKNLVKMNGTSKASPALNPRKQKRKPNRKSKRKTVIKKKAKKVKSQKKLKKTKQKLKKRKTQKKLKRNKIR